MKLYLSFIIGFLGLTFPPAQISSEPPPPQTMITAKKPFSRGMMQAPEYQLETQGQFFLHPSRFSMQQSYSTSYSYSGSSSLSYGLYLNTLSYRLFNPLTFSIDLGIYTPFHASGFASTPLNSQNQAPMGSFVLPRMGLDYHPTPNTLISVQYINLNDAYRAYGPFGYIRSPFSR